MHVGGGVCVTEHRGDIVRSGARSERAGNGRFGGVARVLFGIWDDRIVRRGSGAIARISVFMSRYERRTELVKCGFDEFVRATALWGR